MTNIKIFNGFKPQNKKYVISAIGTVLGGNIALGILVAGTIANAELLPVAPLLGAGIIASGTINISNCVKEIISNEQPKKVDNKINNNTR